MTTHTYPYTMVDGHVILDCGGKRLLLDTGAPSSVAETRTLAFAGRGHVADTNYMGVSLAEIGSHVGASLDGLIGTDILAGYDTLIDPARSEVRVSRNELHLDGTRLQLEFLMGIPVTEVTAAGKPVKMIFDTGAKVSYVSSEVARACPSSGSLEDFFPGIGGFTAQTHTVPITLGLDTITITAGEMPMLLSMALMMAGASGILGAALFEHFAVAYAPRRGEMVLIQLNGKEA